MKAKFNSYVDPIYDKTFAFEFTDVDGKEYKGSLAYVDSMRHYWQCDDITNENFDSITSKIIKLLHEQADVSLDMKFLTPGKTKFRANVILSYEKILIDKFYVIGDMLDNKVVFYWNFSNADKNLIEAIRQVFIMRFKYIDSKKF